MSELKLTENKALGEKYYYTHHKSGLDIYIIPKNFTTSYALFSTKYGAIDNCFRLAGDKEFTRVPDGIAHFLEHKMFENEDGSDTFARFAKYGADANAFTGSAMTAYLFSCSDHFEENLEILLDYVTKPYYTPETVAKEQGIIGQEIRMGEDNPHRALYYNLMDALYKDNQIKLNVAGTVDSIAKITDKLLYKCYEVFYNLSNMMLVVNTAENPETVLRVADKILPIQEPKEIIRSYNSEKPEVNKKRVVAEFEVAKPLFYIGVKDIKISADPLERAKKQATGDILTELLFGASSAFGIEMYESGLANGFAASFDHDRNSSVVYIQGESDDPEKVYEKVVSHTEEAKKNGFDHADFERIKRAEYASYIKSFDSTELAETFTYALHDGLDWLAYGDILAGVTYDDVMALLPELFDEKYYAMSIVKPISK